MECARCHSKHITYNGRYLGIQRYICNGCGKQFSDATFKRFYRHRFPPQIIIISILFHLFTPARVVQLFLFFLFRCYVSKKTICSWTRKFLDNTPEIRMKIKGKLRIAHTDEKFIKIKKNKAYWWNTVDPQGNGLSSLITEKRDQASIKQLFEPLEKVDIMITDAYPAYPDVVKKLRCKHFIAGIKKKMFMYKSSLLVLSNVVVERVHSRIDYFMQRFRNSFENIESANRWRKAFMLISYLQESFALHRSLGTYLTAENQHSYNRRISVPAIETL